MKSADFLSYDPEFEQTVTDVLAARGASVYPGQVQLEEPGPERGMFNYFGRLFHHEDWDSGEYVPAEGVVMPDMTTVPFYYFECRWEEQVAEIAREVAMASPRPVWLVDTDYVVWNAANVDPARVVL